MKRGSAIAAVAIVILFLLLVALAPAASDGEESTFKARSSGAFLVFGTVTFLAFVAGFGVRDAIGRRARRARR